ncbi:MAG: bifunctional phosphoglucose/phosphomannose isomerase [Calditrichia bacterium]
MNKQKQKLFLKYLEDFPVQAEKALEMVNAVEEISYDSSNIRYIVILGMGGSAIAGDLLAAYTESQLEIPVVVIRNYHLPAYVNENSLVIASSYSGNTEETLSAFNEALERKCMTMVISSGGELGELAKQKGLPWITLPEGFPPRQALGYSFFSLLFVLDKMGIIKVNKNDVNETVTLLKDILFRQHPDHGDKKHISYNIAEAIYKHIPVIYTGVSAYYPIARRIQNQLHENAKVLAFSNVIPEMNHNEIVGWDYDKKILNQFSVLFLRDENEDGQIQKRVNITKDIIHKKSSSVIELYPEGKSLLAKMFSLIYQGDWISYYLAVLCDKDPAEIKNIDYLKSKLK